VTPEVSEGDDEFSPAIDFTPPELISMHFTDLGAITPAGLSERVISLRMSKVAGT
jgi:translation initiation factor 2B subunit (eIF-2B alpha/beta/delta family)